MKLFLTWILIAFCQLATAAPEIVDVTLSDASHFKDHAAEAVAWFDTVVDAPEDWPAEAGDCAILDIEVRETPDSKQGKSAAVIRFAPRKSGLVTLGALDLASEGKSYQTRPVRFSASVPKRSDAMSLELVPGKTQVYVGEPLRLDLTWTCHLPAGSLRSLDLHPGFFDDTDVDVVIPRNTDDEKNQVGLPVGGRRVIASRGVSAGNKDELGRLELPMFLRFSTPGIHRIPATRLEIVMLNEGRNDFARYAAYFNNGLFESPDRSNHFDRLFTFSEDLKIHVLPLPMEERDVDFSGLFAPLTIAASSKTDQVGVGQLMELELKLTANAPHGMLELPPLSHQLGLRGRFLMDDDYGRLWQPDGSIFRVRLRALSTSVRAIPSLEFQVFDPAQAAYQMVTTAPIPLTVTPVDGCDFIPLKSFAGAGKALTDHPEGIRENLETNRMNDLTNALVLFANRYFLPLLLAGPILFAALLPWVRERRRRAIDAHYRQRAEAFAAFRKIADGSPEKWPAFLRFMAASFGTTDHAWTVGDSVKALESTGTSKEEIARIVEMHSSTDARDFSPRRPDARIAGLDDIARKVAEFLKAGALPTLMLLGLMLASGVAHAGDWDEAGKLFSEARAAPAGSEQSRELFTQAALKFQAAASVGEHAGVGWYNAGNAWFEAGATGRAIAAFHQARLLRPFDSKVTANLTAARAMTADAVPITRRWWERVPATWLRPAFLITNLVFWCLLLATIRFMNKQLSAATLLAGIACLGIATPLVAKTCFDHPEGVVIVDSAIARKGPGFGYEPAFNEPVHDGLEVRLLETRDKWALVELSDQRQCWLPSSQLQWIVDGVK